MGGWKTSFLWEGLFSGAMLVSGKGFVIYLNFTDLLPPKFIFTHVKTHADKNLSVSQVHDVQLSIAGVLSGWGDFQVSSIDEKRWYLKRRISMQS